MSRFFPGSAHGGSGLALFLNAGDPPLPALADLMRMLDDRRVDCLELAVPFPNSATDGPVIRRSAARALAAGVELHHVLDCIRAVRGDLHHLRIALLADWGHTVKPQSLRDFVGRVVDSGADGLLVHALPPRLRPEHYKVATAAGMPLVTTCYCGSAPAIVAEAVAHASAYLYLVAHYGRSGVVPLGGYEGVAAKIVALRAVTTAPIAVGFGIATRADVARVLGLGADAAIVGSAGVSCVERAHADGRDVVDTFDRFLADISPTDLSRQTTLGAPA